MGKGYCIECNADNVEVRPVQGGRAFVCEKCLSTYSKKWINKKFPDLPENAEGNATVERAISYMGKSHDEIDCSTLIFNSLPDKKLPKESAAQYYKSDKLVPVDTKDLRKGDLIFFKRDDGLENINHVGIVLGVGNDGTITFIHSSSSKGVSISNTNHIGGYGKSTWGQLKKGFRRPK